MRNIAGEIDLIALRFGTIVFIEVKARRSESEVRIQTHQKRRIISAAQVFLDSNPQYNNYCSRFDVVFVQPYKFPVIFKNVWQ